MEYELTTLTDIFDQIPTDKLEKCLDEIKAGMMKAREINEIMRDCAELIDGERTARLIAWPEISIWIDDDKGDIGLEFQHEGETIISVKTKANTPQGIGEKVMEVKEFLKEVAYTSIIDICGSDSEVYKSKFDDSYITHVGMEDTIKHLAEREITSELTHGVGFSPKDGKWYGWSHRAIFGFEVGSECKKGDCHYNGSTLDEQEADAIRFWVDECHENTRCDGVVEKNNEKYFDIKWDYTDDVPNESLRNTIGGNLHHIKPLGRGEWVAKTMADAKQMAKDFNQGVS